MSRKTIILLTIGIILLIVAAVAWAKSPAQDLNMTGQREMHMGNCPSAVPGSTTRVLDLDDGVQLTITAGDDWARREIRRRAQAQGVTSWDPEKNTVEHTGTGTGSGRFGYCPGMLAGTTVDEELMPTGARLTIRAQGATLVKELQRTTHLRLDALKKRRAPTS